MLSSSIKFCLHFGLFVEVHEKAMIWIVPSLASMATMVARVCFIFVSKDVELP